jgi:hypothetical protein
MPNNIRRINEPEEKIRDLLVEHPDLVHSTIDNLTDRGMFAITRHIPDLITATECLVLTKVLHDLSSPD